MMICQDGGNGESGRKQDHLDPHSVFNFVTQIL